MMNKLTKILPVLAIVAGIGGAFGFGAQENPCNTELTGYQSATEPIGTPSENEDLRIPGNFGPVGIGNYDCAAQAGTCRWLFADDPGTPEMDEVWIECPGTLNQHTPPAR